MSTTPSTPDQSFAVVNSWFDGNSAELHGGAIRMAYTRANFTNCVISNNSAAGEGGAIYGSSSGELQLSNSTVVYNTANGMGAGVYRTIRLVGTNSILWGNVSDSRNASPLDSSIASVGSASAEFSHCIVEFSGGSGAWTGDAGTDMGGNLDIDPALVPGAWVPQAASPAIDAGNSALLPEDTTDLDGDGDSAESLPIDLFGSPREIGGAVDIGAVEFVAGLRATAGILRLRRPENSLPIPAYVDLSTLFDDSAESFELVGVAPSGLVTAAVDAVSGLVDIEFAPESTGRVDVIVAAADAGGARSMLVLKIDLVKVYYVDADAGGTADGSSWEDAFTTLQDALAVEDSDFEIWVASGVYHPDEGGGQVDGDPLARFRLRETVAIYGGFAGAEATLAERDLFNTPASILSGDIDQDDRNDDGNDIAEHTGAIVGDNSEVVLSAHRVPRSAVIDGFTITAGENTTKYGGAGFRATESSSVVRYCDFRGNFSEDDGGAVHLHGVYESPSNCTFFNCRFEGNVSDDLGGGVSVYLSHVRLLNCAFVENTSSASGGGLRVDTQSTGQVLNCTFVGNFAGGRGGAIDAHRADSLEVTNSILWDNLSRFSAGAPVGTIYDPNGVTLLSSCIVDHSGGSGSWADEIGVDGGGNSDLDPSFLPRSIAVQASSPAIDEGDSDALLRGYRRSGIELNPDEWGGVDLRGRSRIVGGAVDIGALESPAGPIATSRVAPTRLFPNSGSTVGLVDFGDRLPTASSFELLAVDPPGILGAAIGSETGVLDVDVSPETAGTAVISVVARDEAGTPSAPIVVEVTVAPDVLYVDGDATGSATGLSWGDAFTTIQDVLAIGGRGYDIWVAGGVYRPDEGAGVWNDDPRASFELRDGIRLFGGFAGTETTFAERQVSDSDRSILSGDLAGDDQDDDGDGVTDSHAGIVGENSRHVVTGFRIGSDTILDGFTITAGQANGITRAMSDQGGGMYLYLTDARIRGCRFLGNTSSASGGGMACVHTSSLIDGCEFAGNRARSGGGLSFYRSSPIIKGTAFAGNSAGDGGGGVYITTEASPEFTRCTFVNNASDHKGGAVYVISGASPKFDRCRISGNSALTGGGGAYIDISSTTFTNCLFSGNHAGGFGGAIQNWNVDSAYANCTFAGNAASLGGAFYNRISRLVYRHCILSNNLSGGAVDTLEGSIANPEPASSLQFSNCIVAGSGGSAGWDPLAGADGGGNLDVSPNFLNPLDPGNAPDPGGDYRFSLPSPAIDSGDNSAVGSQVDLLGYLRVVDGDGDSDATVDLGAYEFVPEGLDSDLDSLTDAFEFSVTGSPVGLAFPRIEPFTSAVGDIEFPSITYHADTRLSGLIKVSVERSVDLGRADPWIRIEGWVPISSTVERGVMRVELRSPEPIGTRAKEFFRLAVEVLPEVP